MTYSGNAGALLLKLLELLENQLAIYKILDRRDPHLLDLVFELRAAINFAQGTFAGADEFAHL